VLTLFFVSCEEEEEILPPSTTAKILRFKAASNECDLLSRTWFNTAFTKIYNTDSLPSGTVIKNMKFEISTYFSSKILINGVEWNGIDSVQYEYPIFITVFAQNPDYKKDYELKININSQSE
jgi:hypothetical protein